MGGMPTFKMLGNQKLGNMILLWLGNPIPSSKWLPISQGEYGQPQLGTAPSVHRWMKV